jgi:hypothetical protein
MGKEYAIALTNHGPCFGEWLADDAFGVMLGHPAMLIERKKSETHVERILVPVLATVEIDKMLFNCPWAIVSDKKLEETHAKVRAGRSGLVLANPREIKVH